MPAAVVRAAVEPEPEPEAEVEPVVVEPEPEPDEDEVEEAEPPFVAELNALSMTVLKRRAKALGATPE